MANKINKNSNKKEITKSYKTNTIQLNHTKEQGKILQELAIRVSKLYNCTNYYIKNTYKTTNNIPNTFTLNNTIPGLYPNDYKALPSDIAQEVIAKCLELWKSFTELSVKHKINNDLQNPSFPKYRKVKIKTKNNITDNSFEDNNNNNNTNTQDTEDNFIWLSDYIPIKSSRSYSYDNTHFNIPIPKDLKEKYDIKTNRLEIPYIGKHRYKGKEGRCELLKNDVNNKWYVKISVVVNEAINYSQSKRKAGIDLGIKVFLALSIDERTNVSNNSNYTPTVNSRLFSGKTLLSDWDYFSRQIAIHQQELTSRGLHTSKRLKQLYEKRRLRNEHAVKAITYEVANTCRRNCIETVYIGNPKNIRNKTYSVNISKKSLYSKNPKVKKQIETLKKNNEKINNFWGYSKTIEILKQAFERQNIKVILKGEYNTSSTCVKCTSTDTLRKPRHILTCKKCNFKIHSDVAGSYNMIVLNNKNHLQDFTEDDGNKIANNPKIMDLSEVVTAVNKKVINKENKLKQISNGEETSLRPGIKEFNKPQVLVWDYHSWKDVLNRKSVSLQKANRNPRPLGRGGSQPT